MVPESPPLTALKVLSPGLCTLVVDAGRPRWRSLGVPVGGAADRAALAVGNALVGNPPDAAALEIALAGPTLQAVGEVACVLCGAPFDLATDHQPLTPGKTFTLRPGEVLRVGGTPHGLRAYLCVRGGLRTPWLLDSRSAFEPLRAGAELPCVPGSIRARSLAPGDSPLSIHDDPVTLRILPGPQADWFEPDALHGRRFEVTPASNRMGLRLSGKPLAVPARELVSEPVCPGAVQVTRDGQCIVLGIDGQTIGGYPKIAQVISADLDELGQLRPGAGVHFASVTLAEAEALYREKQAILRQWLVRLRTAEVFAR